MLIKLNSFLTFLFFSIVAFAQNEEVLFTIDVNKFSKKEFIKSYENNKDLKWNQNKDSLKKSLDEFIEFKMKVIEAKSLGIDKSDGYMEDVNSYYKKLAAKYLTDQELLDHYVQQTYERAKTEVWIRQILLRIDPNASLKDSLFAFQKALNIRKKLLSGSDFSLLAGQVSDDPSAAINGGDLWYIKPPKVPYSVENYIYSNNSEKISYPIRSGLGYHIIEIMNKRPNQGRYKVSHILLSHSKNDKDTSDINLEHKADSIYQLAINGVDFAQLSEKFSCDNGTSSIGGELPWFETGKMPREFEEETIKLKIDGAISKPVKTKYGWHIIKRLSHEENPPFDKVKEQFYNLVLESEKGKIAVKKQIEKLKKEYSFKDYNSISSLYSFVDSTIFEGNWQIPFLAELDGILFSFNNQTFYQKDFAQYLITYQKKSYPIPIINYVNSRYDDYIDSTIIDFELKNMEKRFPEFALAMKNFKEKELVRHLMEKSVWKKTVDDETGLMNFYKKNSDNYNKSFIADVCIYSYSADKSNKIEKHYNKISEENLTGADLEKDMQTSVDKGFMLRKCGRFVEGDDENVDKCINLYNSGSLKKDQHLIFFEDKRLLVLLNEQIKKREKPLAEVKSKVITDYQVFLENELFMELKQKYKVTVNEGVFESIKNNN
jgi:peptidyl-prolyl cis-trans isomerase SurA